MNDIIKFKDYIEILSIMPEKLTINSKGRKIILKGDNYQIYIYPILDLLLKKRTLIFLYENLKKRQTSCKITQTIFQRVINKLIDAGILCKYNDSINGSNLFKYNISNISNIIIISFLDYKSSIYIVNKLSRYSCKTIKLINIGAEIALDEFKKNAVNNIDVVNLKDFNYLDIYNMLCNGYLGIVLQSTRNNKLDLILNFLFCKNNISWINCIVNDYSIEMGPFVIPQKTSCLQCFAKNSFELDNKLFIRQYDIYDFTNLLLFTSLLIKEVIAYSNIKPEGALPITINNILKYDSLKNIFELQTILRDPYCIICSQK